MENKYKEMQKYSNLNKVIKNAIKYLGNEASVQISTNKNKKFMVFNPDKGKYIHFGAMFYEDFTKHQDEKRRQNYLKRSMAIKGNWKNNPYSSNNLSIHILWQ